MAKSARNHHVRTQKAGDETVQAGSLIELIPVFSILPDPAQPRDLFPDELSARLTAGEHPTSVLRAWLAYVESGAASLAQRQAVKSLEQLAQTIELHDLIHPIVLTEAVQTEVSPGVGWIIVTGERRWWAHVWLYLTDRRIRGREANEIRAVMFPMDGNIRAVQLIENVLREELTAVERASGLMNLRQEMSRERDRLIPWAEVERELGIDRSYRWRIEQVLTLSAESQQLIRRHRLTEKAIRPIATCKEMQARPDLQLIALRKLIEWQEDNIESGNQRLVEYINRLLSSPKSKEATSALVNVFHLTKTFYRQTGATLKTAQALDAETISHMQRAVTEDKNTARLLRSLRDKLDEILGTA